MTAQERRQVIRQNAERLGINDDYISTLVETFYERIRVDEELGPIFSNVVDDWPPHLARMKDFWASVAFNAGRYSGRPVPKHQALEHVTPAHFQRWLTLFERTLEDTAAGPETVSYFMERANRIAQSLQLAMFGMPGLPKPSWTQK